MAFVQIIPVERRNKKRRKYPVFTVFIQAYIKCFTFKVGIGQLGYILYNPVCCRISFTYERTAGMIDKPSEIEPADIVYPLYRKFRVGYYIFPVWVIKITIFHVFFLLIIKFLSHPAEAS